MAAEVIDSLAPRELILMNYTTATLPASAKLGTIVYDSTTQKLKFWDGAWKAITSA